jgi:hypothetical protein
MTLTESAPLALRSPAGPEEAAPAAASLPDAGGGLIRAALEEQTAIATTGTPAAEVVGARAAGPGLCDLETAVLMVASGLASRVTLCGFPPWQGAVREACRLAEESGIRVIPTLVPPDDRVDIVVLDEATAQQ